MTKVTRSLIASKMGIERAEKALIDLGINKTGLEKRLGFSRSTISSFFNRTKPIDHTYFTKICKTLSLEWEEIVEKDNPMKLDICQIENTIDVETISPRLAAFVIEGSFPVDDLTRAKIQALVKQLQKITGDASLEIVDIQEGSIKIILKGTPKALATIQDLYDSGQLNEVEGISVENVGLILNKERNTSVKNSANNTNWLYKLSHFLYEPYRKLYLTINKAYFIGAYLIGARLSGGRLSIAYLIGAKLFGVYLRGTKLIGTDLRGVNLTGVYLVEANLSGVNLIRANLSKANLSGANLSGANLSGANLSEANLIRANLIRANFSEANLTLANLTYTDVENAIFANNLGISEALKLDLINRGAIFDDSRGNRSGVLTPI